MTTLEIPASEFIKRFQAGEIPASARVTVTYEGDEDSKNKVLAKLHRWQHETATQTVSQTTTQELFQQWDAEDASMTEEETRAENQLWEDVQKGISENRTALGTRQF